MSWSIYQKLLQSANNTVPNLHPFTAIKKIKLSPVSVVMKTFSLPLVTQIFKEHMLPMAALWLISIWHTTNQLTNCMESTIA